MRLFTQLSLLGTLRRAVSRPASMADAHPRRTLRLGVYFPPFGAHGWASAPRPSLLPAGGLISLGSEPDGPANGRQPARRVAMRMPLVAGSRRRPWRWPSQADQDSRQMKTTGHGYASGDVYIGGRRPRPEDGSRRSRMGSPAFMAQKYHAEPRRAPRVRLFTHLSPLGTLLRSVRRPASRADVHPRRTLRLGLYFPPFGAHGWASAPRPSLLPAGGLISLGSEPSGPANGRQPARRVAMSAFPLSGSRR